MSNKNEYIARAVINPLSIIEIDIPTPNIKPTIESFIEFFCIPYTKPELENLISRYKDISKVRQVVLAPNEKDILEKIIYPLKNAKSSYIMGNFLGTISLCGMIAEMIAINTFDISKEAIKISNTLLTNEQEQLLFGKKFEKLGQDQRIKVLFGLKLINSVNKDIFDEIRIIRKKYLHLFSADYSEIEKDSKKAYENACLLAINLIGQDFIEGKLLLNPAFAKFLIKKGILTKNK